MQRTKKAVVSFVLFLMIFSGFFQLSIGSTQAQGGGITGTSLCTGNTTGVMGIVLPPYSPGNSHTITYDASGWSDAGVYSAKVVGAFSADKAETSSFRINQPGSGPAYKGMSWEVDANKVITLKITEPDALKSDSINHRDFWVYLYRESSSSIGGVDTLCLIGTYKVPTADFAVSMTFSQDLNGQTCTDPGCLLALKPTKLTINAMRDGKPFTGQINIRAVNIDNKYDVRITNGVGTTEVVAPSGDHTFNAWWAEGLTLSIPTFQITIPQQLLSTRIAYKTVRFSEVCEANQCKDTPAGTPTPRPGGPGSTGVPKTIGEDKFSLCEQIPQGQVDASGGDMRLACVQCAGGEGGTAGVWTAIGCIKREPERIIGTFVRVGLGMAGGFTLLTFLAAGFIFSTSQGDVKEYGKAKEMATSSIAGLLFIIFSVTILEFIGFSILRIPGFGG